MGEEVETELGVVAHPQEGGIGDRFRLVHGVRTEIGQLPAFDVAPHQFDRIEVG